MKSIMTFITAVLAAYGVSALVSGFAGVVYYTLNALIMGAK
jgi:hypothetical protein